MAWRIHEHVIRGEIDNRVRGRVTGEIWLAGRAEPLRLELRGDPWRDLAGHVLRFTNPAPVAAEPGALDGLATEQRGAVGDLTASRKVKVPDCTMEELRGYLRAKLPFPWHWSNSVYLEWHGERNGRVVIESADFQIEISPEAAWRMDEADDAGQRAANDAELTTFVANLADAAAPTPPDDTFEDDVHDADAPTSAAEARADAAQARLDLLIDRVRARVQRARLAGEEPDFTRFVREESARLRRELGEPPSAADDDGDENDAAALDEAGIDATFWGAQLAEAAAEEIAAEDEIAREVDAAACTDSDDEMARARGELEARAPLVHRCVALWERVRSDGLAQGWLNDTQSGEHPLWELANGVMLAGGKLAGVIGAGGGRGEWPPPALFAPEVLVRLKKARGYLRDAAAGLEAAEEQALADAGWRAERRAELTIIGAEVDRAIAEVRAVLEQGEVGGDEASEGDESTKP